MNIVLSINNKEAISRIPEGVLFELPFKLCKDSSRKPFIIRMESTVTLEEINQAISYAPCYIDIPGNKEMIFFETCRKKNIQTVASYHDYEKTEKKLDTVFTELKKKNPDVIKIVTFANASSDAEYVLDFLKEKRKEFPIIAFCMGEKGVTSRIAQLKISNLWTYVCLEKGLETAPGQLSLAEMQSILGASAVDAHFVSVALPPSKSQTLRAILFASLSPETSKISNILPSNDSVSMVEACKALGATISEKDGTFSVTGFQDEPQAEKITINAGNSGIVLRFIGALAATFSIPVTIEGDDSMQKRRSCKELIRALLGLGADVSSRNDHVPLTIVGPIQPGITVLSGEDSQPVSALLIASARLSGTSHIFVENPGEKPWVQLTLSWLKNIGVRVENDRFSHFTVYGAVSFPGFEYRVPGDLSSLGYIVVAALTSNAHVAIHDVDLNDPQGDKVFLLILERMGAHFGYDEKNKVLYVCGPQQLTSNMSLDINDCIDMVTLLAVVGCFASGKLEIVNCEVAKDKESNRPEAIVEELKKMGASIVGSDEHIVVSSSKLMPAELSSHNDHRVLMALYVAASSSGIQCSFDNVECVQKSFPNFFEVMEKIYGRNIDRLSRIR